MMDGKGASGDQFLRVKPDLQTLIDGGRDSVRAEQTRQNRGRLEQATSVAGLGDKVEFDAHFLEVLGRPAGAWVHLLNLRRVAERCCATASVRPH
jgi:hypothetical protein